MNADVMKYRAENPPTQHLFHNFGTIYFSQKSQMTGMFSWNLHINVFTSEVPKTGRWVIDKKSLVYQIMKFFFFF